MINDSKKGLAKLKNALGEKDAKKWYKNTTMSDDIADLILKFGIYELFSIRKITRFKNSYNMNHDGVQKDENPNNEKHICKKMFRTSKNGKYDEIGKIIDYETPIRNTADDKGYKGIDMISYNAETNTLILLETKNQSSPETLLRAAMEVFTYWKVVDHQKLLYDFNLPYDTLVKKAVLLFKDTRAYDEYYKETSPITIELMKTLGVEFYGIKEKDGDYEVFIPKRLK